MRPSPQIAPPGSPFYPSMDWSPAAIKRNDPTLRHFFLLQLFFVMMMVSFSWGGKIAFGLILALPPCVAWFTGGRNRFLHLLYFICVTFAIGQRTLQFGPFVRIVPGELLMWALAAACLFFKAPTPRISQKVPGSVWVLCFAAAFAILLNQFRDGNLNLAIFYAKYLWLAVPTFWVTAHVVQRMQHLKNIVSILVLASLFLSFLAIAEYYNFGFLKYFSGYLKSNVFYTSEGFIRAGASFWGGPSLAFLINLIVPLILAQWYTARSIHARFILAVTMGLALFFIYLAGHRGIWFTTGLAMGCFFYLRGVKGIFVFVVLATIGMQFVPEVAKKRAISVYGAEQDPSAFKRELRAKNAIRLIQERPFLGHGWGFSGLVHSDWLQLWADAGIVALLAMIYLYGKVLKRLFLFRRGALIKEDKVYCHGLIASLVGYFFVLGTQTFFNLPEQYTPFWFVFALAYHFPNVARLEREPTSSPPQSTRS